MVTIAKINEKGQLTIPKKVRKIVLKGNKYVSLVILPHGRIVLTPIKVTEKVDYTEEEMEKIEKLAAIGEEKIYKTPKSAKKHLKSL